MNKAELLELRRNAPDVAARVVAQRALTIRTIARGGVSHDSIAAMLHLDLGEVEQAIGWLLQVLPTTAGQWGWAVLDPDDREIAGGAGYDSESDARQDGEAELAVQKAPLKALIV